MLGTDAETVSDLVHVTPDVITIDDCCTRCWCVQTCTEREREGSVEEVSVRRGGLPVSMEMVVVLPAPL